MKYPKWLPYPKAWGQAIMLCLELIPVIMVVKFFLPIQSIFHYTSFKISLTHSILSVVAIILSVYGLALIHQFFWDEPLATLPKWCPRGRCFLEGAWGFSVFAMSTFAGFMITRFIRYELNFYFWDPLSIAMSLSIIIMAYSYQLRTNLFSKIIKSGQNIDPIEKELTRLKTELRKMNKD